MGKGGRRETQNGNHSSSFFPSCNSYGKAEQTILKPCKRCEGEISKLREINQMLIKDTNSPPQDFKACFLHKVAQMESQIHILQAASTNFESRMNNQFIQQVKIGEELGDNLMKIDNEFRQHLVKRDEECDAGISKAGKQLEEAEERFEREIAEKEEDCRAVFSDKQTLESSVLQLTDKIKVMSEEFDEARKAWELEKEELFSQIVASRKETEEIAKSNQIAEQAWNADEENLLCSLDMSSLNERVLLEKIELESQLNESKERTEELLKKHDDDRYLWCSEKQNFRDNASKLETKIFNMATERGFLCQRNRTLIAEVEFLKAQLKENIAKVAQMQDERVQIERVLQQYRTENIDLQFNLNDSQEKSQDLLRKIKENTHFWGAEKSNLEGNVAELRSKHELMASEMVSLTQKNRDLTVDLELIKCQLNALESELNESKKRSLELLQKSEEDRHMWDEEKSNLKRTLAELQTKNEDLMLQLSRKKAVEEEFLAAMSSLQEMKEYTSKGEIQIANLRSQLLAVAEKKDGQISDLQRQISAMAEEKKGLLANLQDQLSSIAEGKKILDEIKCLQSELDKRTSASEEEKVILQGRVRELQTTFDSLNNELESSRAMAEEKDRQFADLQIRQSELEEAKKHLEKKNDSLVTELNRCTMSRDENIRLQNRIRELGAEADSLKKDSESKENCLQNLMLERQPVCRKALVPVVNANGTPKRNGALNEKTQTKRCSS